MGSLCENGALQVHLQWLDKCEWAGWMDEGGLTYLWVSGEYLLGMQSGLDGEC